MLRFFRELLLDTLKEKEKAEKLKQKMSSAGVGGSEPIIKVWRVREWGFSRYF